ADDDGVDGFPGIFEDLGPGHPAVVLGVVVIGKIVGEVSVVASGGILGDAVHCLAAAAAAYHDVRAQVLQPLAPDDGQAAGHHQDAGVPGGGAADGQRRAETAGTGFHHRHTGL